MYKTFFSTALVFSFFVFSFTACKTKTDSSFLLESPDKGIALHFLVSDDQLAYYSIRHQDSIVLEVSKLGIIMEDEDFSQNLKVEKISDPTIIEESYEMVQGKRRDRTYLAHEQTVEFSNAAGVIFPINSYDY